MNAIEEQRRSDILPLALAIVGAGVLRLGLTVVRRLIAGKVSVAVEFDLRERLYGHLQALELGFFDSQQTGQLMSRATVDLQSIRFFLGYGLIFLTQNALTLALASAVMFAIKPDLAALALLPVPFVVLSAMRYSRRSRPAVQEVQQRLAELTGEVEEGDLRHPDREGVRPRAASCSSGSAARWGGCSTRRSTRPACRRSTRR